MTMPQMNSFIIEDVPTGEDLSGVISDLKIEPGHKFVFHAKNGDVQESFYDAIRFIFKLNGFEQEKYSKWMKFSYNERATLYTKYISKLVEGAEPNMKFDIEQLIGMPILIEFSRNINKLNNRVYYNVENIKIAKGASKRKYTPNMSQATIEDITKEIKSSINNQVNGNTKVESIDDVEDVPF